MKVITILMVFLCNFSLSEAQHSDVTLLTALKSQSKDTVAANELRIRPFYLEIIPPSSGVQFYRNGIIFLSYSKLEEKIPERHLSFGSVKTYTSIVSDTIPANIEQFNIKGTTLFPSEATTFSGDFNTMYLSLIPEKSSSEKIFRAFYTKYAMKTLSIHIHASQLMELSCYFHQTNQVQLEDWIFGYPGIQLMDGASLRISGKGSTQPEMSYLLPWTVKITSIFHQTVTLEKEVMTFSLPGTTDQPGKNRVASLVQ